MKPEARKRFVERFARQEWERARGKSEPTWEQLSSEARRVWLADTDEFVGRMFNAARVFEAAP